MQCTEQSDSMEKRNRKVGFRLAGIFLLLYMLSFTSCDTADICWYCENHHDPSDWQYVCDAMSKNKLESYGWVCSPY